MDKQFRARRQQLVDIQDLDTRCRSSLRTIAVNLLYTSTLPCSEERDVMINRDVYLLPREEKSLLGNRIWSCLLLRSAIESMCWWLFFHLIH
jgi:hypothetical protein